MNFTTEPTYAHGLTDSDRIRLGDTLWGREGRVSWGQLPIPKGLVGVQRPKFWDFLHTPTRFDLQQPKSAWSHIFVTRMLTRDLLAIADLSIDV